MSASIVKDVIFTGAQYAWLREHLFQEDQKEQSAYAFVAPSRSGDRLRLLTHHIMPIHPENYDEQSKVYLSLKHEVAVELAQRVIESDWSLVEIHSHPFADQSVAFSATDTDYAMPRFRWFAEQIESRDFYHVMMVFGQNSADAIMYDKSSDAFTPIDSITVLNRPLLTIPTESSNTQQQAIPPRLSRQVQAFGSEGLHKLRSTRVGIVGLGGTGSAVVNQLALMGVRDFVLVDDDVVEMTNLNRLYGAYKDDVEQGLSKVEVARRSIEKIDAVNVTAIAEGFPSPSAVEALKNVDLLFGCTDSHGSRLQLNEFSLQYMLPYIDTALGIFSDGDGRINEAGGEVRTVIPGEFCLNCLGAINAAQAAQDLLPDDLRDEYVSRGYIDDSEDIPAPSIVFLNNTIASLAVGEFLNLLTGYKAPAHMLYYSLSKDSLRRIAASRDSSCVACTPNGRLARGDTEAFFRNPSQMDDLSVPPLSS